LCECGVGAILSFLRRGNVGSTLAATTVKSVACGAAIFERLASFCDGAFTLRWVILRHGCTFNGESEGRERESHRNDSESFESEELTRIVQRALEASASSEGKFESLATGHRHNFSRDAKISERTRLLTS
jgi:hypothetical protein